MDKQYEILKKEKDNIIRKASDIQRDAADPNHSVWVSASAGTGKTRILTHRVLRLLLNDILPHRILCLTFTNAAASEMNDRIQDNLAKWANMHDEDLSEKLEELIGMPPDAQVIEKAKKLFAKTLESPGGLRIQTIHGFCQKILMRFPVEAGIPPNFSIIDPMQSEELLREARNEIMMLAARGAKSQNEHTPLTKAINILLKEGSEYALTKLLNKTRFYRQEILDLITAHDYEEIEKIYGEFLQVPQQTTLTQLYQKYFSQLMQRSRHIKELMNIFEKKGGKKEKEYAIKLDNFFTYPEKQSENIDTYASIFLTAKGQPKSNRGFPTKNVLIALPQAQKYIEYEQDALLHLFEDKARLSALKNSLALTRLSGEVLKKWQENKLSHMLLDYDDLIERTSRLLKDNLSWVHYKLDEGIDHILVDEAQDTSPKQWKIIWRLAKEFFEDLEQNNHKNRTLFVVGDFKQSIYSFQGAKPQEFIKYQKRFQEIAAQAHMPFFNIELETNFRSSPPILQFTDNVINLSARQGVLHYNEKPLTHHPVRRFDAGNVEIWPLLEKQESKNFEFTFPPNLKSEGSNTEKMAENIATRIHQLLSEKFYVSSQNRPCEPKDFLILVRKRNPLVTPLIKALNAQNIPVFGADRIDILEQIGVQDLLALARFMLQPKDDYSLACVLRSPLFDITEDDLFNLSFERSSTLFSSLKDKQNNNAHYKNAYKILSHWRSFVDFRTPFQFFSQILSENQYERLILRLSGEAKDAIHEFLEFCLAWEKRHPPLLETFMRAIDSGNMEIKREYESDEVNAVRIMTVHGSKGLQAPIVILPECSNSIKGRDEKVQRHQHGNDCLLFWTNDALPEIMRFEDEDKKNEDMRENHRLLYVALTRAEDKLIIGGIQQSQNKRSDTPHTWYDHILNIFENGHCHFEEQAHIQLPHLENSVQIFKNPYDFRPRSLKDLISEQHKHLPLPDYFYKAAPPERRPYNPLTPGQVMDDIEIAARSPLDNTDLSQFFNRGIIIHKLLELLPQTNKQYWQSIAANFLSQKNWQLTSTQQQQIYQEVINVLNHPDFTEIFHTHALVEVPISGILKDDIISGRIDRLLIKEDEILLIDFKTNRRPPQNPQEVANIYIKQLKIYKELLSHIWPNKPIKCALLWTDNCTLMPMDDIL